MRNFRKKAIETFLYSFLNFTFFTRRNPFPREVDQSGTEDQYDGKDSPTTFGALKCHWTCLTRKAGPARITAISRIINHESSRLIIHRTRCIYVCIFNSMFKCEINSDPKPFSSVFNIQKVYKGIIIF